MGAPAVFIRSGQVHGHQAGRVLVLCHVEKRLSGFVEAACASGAILERISLTRDSHQEEKPDATLRGPHPKPSTGFGSNRLHRGRISSPVVFFYRSISSLCRDFYPRGYTASKSNL